MLARTEAGIDAFVWAFNLKFRSGNPKQADTKNPTYATPFPAPEPSRSGAPFASAWQLAQKVRIINGAGQINPVDLDSCSKPDPSRIP
jgi:hypothetical protein